MIASDIMTKEVVTIGPQAPIREAINLMMRKRISGLPVVEGGRLIGIITEGDLLRRAETGTEYHHSKLATFLLSPGRLAREYVKGYARTVCEVMTGDVITVSPETPVAQIVSIMQARAIKRLPVVQEGRVVGLVSRSDLLKALAQILTAGAPTALSDVEIRKRLLAEIDRQPWAPRACIDVGVAGGIAELRGVVNSEDEREALHVVAENTPGVKAIRDHLIWVEPYSGMAIDGPPAIP